MSSKILINAIDPEEVRIAKVQDSRMEEFQIEMAGREILHGNIYKAIITRVEPSLQAVFIDFGGERNGFLQQHEIHSDYFQESDSGQRTIDNLVKKGQEIMVQVTKDPMMKKGAMLTTYISLPGRYVVLMPGTNNRGISRKIEDEEERKRLKEILVQLKIPEGFGTIVRTAGQGCTKTQLAKDISYLLRLWRDIKNRGLQEAAPAALYKDRSLAVRSVRDYLTPDVNEILIDDEAAFQEVKNFVQIISPRHKRIVKHYTLDKPIFTKYQLEDQIATIFENRVPLKSGGSIVIEQTEALVAIDVNSGRGTREKDLEQTALNTNLEAAEEVARQIRLRDLGGLIVVDFIDMREMKNRNAIERALREHVKRDKARVRIGRISQFGLLELARQRLAPSIELGSLVACPYCKGKGLTPSTETLALRFLRQLKTMTRKSGLQSVHGSVPKAVADYVLNKKRKEIMELEMQRGFSLTIEGDAGMPPHECHIDCYPEC